MQIEIVIPLRTPTLNDWQRMHWAKRRRIGQAMAWAILAQRVQFPPGRRMFERCHVQIWRESTMEPDHDGLIGGLKPLLDALQPSSKRHPYGLGLIADDSPRCVLSLTASHVASKASRTRIVITEAQ